MDEQGWLNSIHPREMLDCLQSLRVTSKRKLRLFAVACCQQTAHLLDDVRSLRALEVAERYADNQTTQEELTHAMNEALLSCYVGDSSGIMRHDAWACTLSNPLISAQEVLYKPCIISKGEQIHLLRDIFGNPFRPLPYRWFGKYLYPGDAVFPLDDADFGLPVRPVPWLTPTVLSLAHAAYTERTEQYYLPITTNIGTINYRCMVCGYLATESLKENHRKYCTGKGKLDLARLSILSDSLEEAGCTDQEILRHLRKPTPHVRGCYVLDLLLGKE